MSFVIKKGRCFLGRTLKLSTGAIELAVTLDVGPRIISAKLADGKNIFFEDKADAINHDCSAVYGEGARWHIYGGHRIWISPEDETTYFPDNSKVKYRVEGDSVCFTTAAWAVKNVIPELKITLIDANTVRVDNTLTSTADGNPISVWCLTVCKSGGVLTLPLSTENTGYLANRNLVLWSYTSLKDKRLSIADDKIVIKSSTKAQSPLKIGLFSENITAEYRVCNTVFAKTAVGAAGVYPDRHCNLETYTNNLIHEVETLSPLVVLNKGEGVTQTEIWSLTAAK